MSDSPAISPDNVVPDAVPEGVREPSSSSFQAAPVTPQAWWLSRFSIGVLCVVAGAGLVASMLLWQKLGAIQEELARRSTDTGTQAIEAKTLARQAQEGMLELSARMGIAENRLGEVSLQRTQLEELMQSLSRSRDENLVVDIESALRLAQQQAQLTGSAEPLLAALRSAEQRLSRAAQPRLNPLRRALSRDAERIKSAAVTDVPALLLKLDELSQMADDLPVANAVMMASPAAVSQPVPEASGAVRPPAKVGDGWLGIDAQTLRDWSALAMSRVSDEARKLLRVSRIDQPEAALLAPDQSYFLHENLKLKLLNARLAILSRQTDTARADLSKVQTSLSRYFDPASRKTQAAANLLAQVQTQLRTSEMPRLDETFTALATAAAGR